MYRRRILLAWAPLVGEDYAQRIFRAYLPTIFILVTLLLSQASGVLKVVAESKGGVSTPMSTAFGVINLLAPLVVLFELVILLISLRRLRKALRAQLSATGMRVTSELRIGTPSRFLAWCREQYISQDQAFEALTRRPPSHMSESL